MNPNPFGLAIWPFPPFPSSEHEEQSVAQHARDPSQSPPSNEDPNESNESNAKDENEHDAYDVGVERATIRTSRTLNVSLDNESDMIAMDRLSINIPVTTNSVSSVSSSRTRTSRHHHHALDGNGGENPSNIVTMGLTMTVFPFTILPVIIFLGWSLFHNENENACSAEMRQYVFAVTLYAMVTLIVYVTVDVCFWVVDCVNGIHDFDFSWPLLFRALVYVTMLLNLFWTVWGFVILSHQEPCVWWAYNRTLFIIILLGLCFVWGGFDLIFIMTPSRRRARSQ